jgi:hypothetical protein
MVATAPLARQASPHRVKEQKLELDRLMELVERDAARHTAAPADEQELQRLEEDLGHALPGPFRRFLERSGAGLYYERHEIFGPSRVMIHDIELVPPLRQVCRGLPPGIIPVHRSGNRLHFMDVRQDGPYAAVFQLVSGARYRDFPSFLEAVVLPPGAPSAVP